MALTRSKYDRLEKEHGEEMNILPMDSDEDDRDYSNGISDNNTRPWWFQEPAVKRNKLAVILTFFLFFCGIGSIFAGVAMEVVYHSGMNDIFRGFVLFAVGGLMLIPSSYALLHIYLAAKRVGRVRFSSVWFFTS